MKQGGVREEAEEQREKKKEGTKKERRKQEARNPKVYRGGEFFHTDFIADIALDSISVQSSNCVINMKIALLLITNSKTKN